MSRTISPGKISLSSAIKKRGRPQNPYTPDALLPFRKDEIASQEQFEHQSKPVKKSVSKRRACSITGIPQYSADDIEFMNALSEYKRCNGRVFPTCCEILAILKKLGYAKTTP
ncbi:MAG: hypothetical protein LBT46_02580 [Planctomycetaceae bacterium]|jgi:hypothetical protein|nr:hypothetical protein [Planctomycetaceae bacterium]